LRYAGRTVVSKVGSRAVESLVGRTSSGGGGGGVLPKGAAVVSKVSNVKI